MREPGVDVAAELDDLEVGAEREELGAAADARGPDAGALGDLGDRVAGADPDVGGVLARRDADEAEALGQLAGQVLGAVDGEVDLAVEQRPLDLADEARLVVGVAAADGPPSSPEVRIDDELGVADRVGDRARLRQRQGAAAGADPQTAQGLSPRPGRRAGAAA